MPLGPFIKQIRIQKGISQSEASSNVVTQSNYSKFELGKIDITAVALFKIIHNLDIGFEEFIMLYENEYSNELDEIINNFFKMGSNKKEDLLKIRNLSKNYLERTRSDNQTLQHIVELTYALEAISEHQDYEKAKLYANPIWNNLQKRDRWYLREITLLNTILYVFPFETAIEITKRSLLFLEMYPQIASINVLKVNLLINISLICIKKEKYKLAISYLTQSLTITRLIPIEFYRILVQMRLAYCKASIGEDYMMDCMSGIMYFYSTNNTDMLNHLKKEAQQYCKNPQFIETINFYEKKLQSIL